MNRSPLSAIYRGAVGWTRRHRLATASVLVAIAALFTVSWFVSLAASPARHAGAPLRLDAYGYPGVEVTVIYPTRLSVDQTGERAARVTLSTRALEPSATEPIAFALPLPDEAVAFVDAQGDHVAGRVRVTPGYPDARPHDLRLAHGNTQRQGGLLFPYRVRVVPLLLSAGGSAPIPELAFEVRLESIWGQSARTFAAGAARNGTPYVLLLGLSAGAVLLGQRARRRRVVARERQLATVYGQLSEHIKLERWGEARQLIESIRAVQPHYRDVDRIDTLVSSAETATWRREQLYQIGVEAYRTRNWPSAVQAFGTIQRETPYYREVHFLRRTAALYADLGSRDRSRRVQAAKELGEIADLVDMTPLLHALADRSEAVADAAEAALHHIGPDALDALLVGLVSDRPATRERSFRLIQGLGQTARPALLSALRSDDPRLTAPVAALLATLGAREELAEALLVAPEPHQEGIVAALLSEGMAAGTVLIEALLAARPERQQMILNAIGALKLRVDLDRRIEEVARATRDPAQRELLQRAQRTPPAPYHVAADAPAVDAEREPAPVVAEGEEPGGSRVLRLFERRVLPARAQRPRGSPED